MVEPDDVVWVPDPSGESNRWLKATFVHTDPSDMAEIEDPRIEGGKRMADFGRVRFDDGTTRLYEHKNIRHDPPPGATT